MCLEDPLTHIGAPCYSLSKNISWLPITKLTFSFSFPGLGCGWLCKAGHKCTRGWPRSIPTGILGTNSHTQIHEDSFPRITQSRESKTHKFTGTHGYSLMTDLHRYSQVYSWVPASRTENLCWLDGGPAGLSEPDLIIPSQQMIKSHAVNNNYFN